MKKSQFYVLAAILFLGGAFLIFSGNSLVFRGGQSYYETKNYLDNYLYEGTIVVSRAIMHNLNVSYELRKYTEAFIDYGRINDREIGIVYVLLIEQSLLVVNYINEPVLVGKEEIVLENREGIIINFTNSLSLKYGNVTYLFEFGEPSKTELRALMAVERGVSR